MLIKLKYFNNYTIIVKIKSLKKLDINNNNINL